MTPEDKQSYLLTFHKFQQNREKHFAPKFYHALKAQYSQFLTAYKSGQSVSNSLMSISAAGIRALLKELYIDAGVNYGWKIYQGLPKARTNKARMPIGFNREMVELINQYFEGGILDTSEGITDTTRDAIRVIMQIANEEGHDLDWIEEQLITESEDLNRSRSRLIARTETVTASNQAAFFAAAKTGLLMTKEWLSAQDNRVRSDHQTVNGSKIDMEGFFTVGDSKMALPGAKIQENGLPSLAAEVCNCRCVCLFQPVRNVQGRLVEFNYGVWDKIAA